MKKIIALILIICICATLAFSFSSCGDKKEDEGIATEEGTKEFVSENLIKKVRLLKTREEVHNFLNAEFFRHNTKYGRFELYKISDKRMASVSYSEEKKDPTGMSDTVSSVEIVDTVDVALIDQIKEGYNYDKITEIFGGIKGERKTSRYWGIYRYVLSDGRLLYIDYDEPAFVTEVYIIEENGEATYIIGTPPKEPIIFEDLDSFKQYLLTTYKGKETTIPVPKLVSNEYKHLKAQDTDKYFFYSFRPIRHVSTPTTHYAPEHFYVTVYKEDDSYQKLVDEDKATEFDGYAFTESKKEYSSQFFFNNNGRCVRISVPTDFNLKGKIIDTLEELNKYIVIEYLDISENSNLN